MLKIALVVALRLVLVGIITLVDWALFTGIYVKGFGDLMKNRLKTNNGQISVVATGSPVKTAADPIAGVVTRFSTNLAQEMIKDTTYGRQLAKKEKIIEDSKNAYNQAQKEVASFKAQYKKPPECYDMKDDVTWIRCANEFIRARKAYEALNQ